jgi:Uncharacterized protein conserved in bacteria
MTSLRLNLGCGNTAPAGWENCDCSWNAQLARWPTLRRFAALLIGRRAAEWPPNVKYVALGRRFPWKDGSACCVYASHVLEHLTKDTTSNFFTEAYRVLAPGGILRIVVPDLHHHAKAYVASVGHGQSGAGHFLYVLNMRHAEARGLLLSAYHLLMGEPHLHKTMYDEVTLRHLMMAHGFTSINVAAYGTSAYLHDVTQVEYRGEGYEGSLYMEARKPF